MKQRAGAVLLVVVLAHVSTAAADRGFPLGPYGRFHLDIPEGWTAKIQGEDAAGGPAINLEPASGAPVVLLVTPLPMPDTAPPREKFLTAMSADVVARTRPIAEETNVEAKKLQGKACSGFYVSATDKTVTNPTRDDFKYASQGAIHCERAFATFTIFSNLASGPERDQALKIVESASYESTNVPVPDKNGTVALAFPGKPWELRIDLPGFRFEPSLTRDDGSGVRLSGQNPKTGVIVSAFLESSSPGLSAVEHREASWKILLKDPGLPYTDLRRSEASGMARLDRIVTGSPSGTKVHQKNVNVYAVRDELWLDVHLSKMDYTAADDPLFEAIVKTIRFSE